VFFRHADKSVASKNKTTSFKSRFEKNQSDENSMTFENCADYPSKGVKDVGQSLMKSNNFNSNFETIREEEHAGNHQSPGLNRDLEVPEDAGPDDSYEDDEAECDERPADCKVFKIYGAIDGLKSPPDGKGNAMDTHNSHSEFKDKVHSLKKLGVERNVSGRNITPSFLSEKPQV
jgi:hypothetical protein